VCERVLCLFWSESEKERKREKGRARERLCVCLGCVCKSACFHVYVCVHVCAYIHECVGDWGGIQMRIGVGIFGNVYIHKYNTSSLPHNAHTISSQIKRENEFTCANSIQVHVCTNVSMVYLMYQCVRIHTVYV